MFRAVVLTLGLFVASFALLASASGAGIGHNVDKIAVEVITVKSFKDFQPKDAMLKLKLNVRTPGIVSGEEADPTEQEEIIIYSIGSRVDGDWLLVESSNSDQYTSLQDVELSLQYPRPDANSNAIVTYVEIVVSQSSDVGNAYIVEGGVGQRNIKIMVEVGNTSFYKFAANIYGY